MKVLFDTNVLVAALVDNHIHYSRARPWYERVVLSELELVVSSHSLLEFYSAVTRSPRNPMPPAMAKTLIRREIVGRATMIALTSLDYLDIVESISDKHLIGGIIYDGLIIQAAKLAKVDHILTFNTKHFLRIWPEGSAIIIEP